PTLTLSSARGREWEGSALAGAAPVVAAVEAQRDRLAVAPMGGIGLGNQGRGDEVQIFGGGRRAAGPIVGPVQRDVTVYDPRLGVRNPGPVCHPYPHPPPPPAAHPP